VVWAILLVAGLLAFAKFPAFRKTVLIIAGGTVLLVIGYLAYDQQQKETSKRLVRTDQLDFADMRLSPDGSDYKLMGRVKNNSTHEVFIVTADIRVLDCDQDNKCDVIGEEQEDILPGSLPAGQVRDIDETVYFSGNTKPRGRFEWNYRITEVRAHE
jgi:hypothetical protein